MFQSINIKFSIASLFTIISLFLIVIFLQNQTTMIITMDSKNKKSLNPQFYFAEKDKPLNETNSRKAHTITNNQYYFSLPNLDKIKIARFDPSKKINTILIKDITIIDSQWFKTTTYKLATEKLHTIKDIKNLKKSTKGLYFESIGGDPQLLVDFSLEKDFEQSTLHFKSLLSTLIIFMVLLFLYHIYKTEKLDHKLSAKLIIYSLFLAFALFKVMYYKDHVNRFNPPDELAHLAYIYHIHNHDDVIPKFEDMRMLNNKKAGNYLSHPPLYYQFMNIIYNDKEHIYKTVNNFRELNVLIFITSFILLLYIGFTAQISLLSHFAYLSVITSIPMYAYSGGSITNDNLAILGAMVFIVGLKKLLDGEYKNLTYFILGLGIFLAYFSKLTAAILIFFALIFFLLYTFKNKTKLTLTKNQFLILLLFFIPIAYYQLYILLTYHSLLPAFHVTYPEQYLHSVYYVPEEYRQHLSKTEWLSRMKMYITGGWFGIHSHHSFVKDTIYEYLGLLLLHIFAIVTIVFKCNKDTKSYCILGKIGILSLFMVLVVQFVFSYKTHLSSGYMGGLQPRYLLPFMFAFAIMASLFVERFKQYFLFTIFIILVCIHALYSDFFYFLQYYK